LPAQGLRIPAQGLRIKECTGRLRLTLAFGHNLAENQPTSVAAGGKPPLRRHQRCRNIPPAALQDLLIKV